MAALNTGAGVVAFISIASEAAKGLYMATQAYRDGPQDVEQLLDAVGNLQLLTERLSTLLRDPDLVLPAALVAQLKSDLKASEKQLIACTSRLERCRPSHNDTPMEWLLSRLRPIVCQDEFEKIRWVVLRQLAVLSIHIETVNGHRTAAIGKAVEVLDKRTIQHNLSMQGAMAANEGILQAIECQLNSLPIQLQQQLCSFSQNLIDGWCWNIGESFSRVEMKISSIASSILSILPTVGQERSNVTRELSESTLNDNVSMVKSVADRFLALRMSNAKSRSYTECGPLLRDFRDMLPQLQPAKPSSSLRGSVNLDLEPMIRIAKNADAVVTSKGHLSLEPRFDRSGHAGEALQVETTAGALLYWSRTSTDFNHFETRFDAALSLLVGGNAAPCRITVFVSKASNADSSTQIHSLIRVYRVVPCHSPVFKAIYNGNLTALQTLLRTGKASIWDCDPKGRGLLNHALYASQMEIAKYLSSQGADIDSPELRLGRGMAEGLIPPLAFWDPSGRIREIDPDTRAAAIDEPRSPISREESIEAFLGTAHSIYGRTTKPKALPPCADLEGQPQDDMWTSSIAGDGVPRTNEQSH